MSEDASKESKNPKKKKGLTDRLVPALLAASVIVPLGMALNYALNVIVAQLLPVEGYGVFAYSQSLATLLALVSSLGFSSSMMRFVAMYKAQNEVGLLGGLLRKSLCWIIAATVLMIGGLLIIREFQQDDHGALLWAAVLLIPLTLDSWRESAMRGLHRTTQAILPRQVLLPMFSVVVLLMVRPSETNTAMTIFVAIFVGLEIFGLYKMRGSFKFVISEVEKYASKIWIKTSVPMAFTQLARQGINRWDVVMLGAFVGMDAVGPYAAAARTALLANVALRVVNLVVGPMLAELYHSQQYRQFRQLLVISSLITGAVALPLYLVAVLKPESLLLLFGSDYKSGAVALQILVSGQFVNIATGPVGQALAMTKHEITNLKISVFGALVSLIGLFILIPKFGLVGGAAATAFSTSIINVGACAAAFLFFRNLK